MPSAVWMDAVKLLRAHQWRQQNALPPESNRIITWCACACLCAVCVCVCVRACRVLAMLSNVRQRAAYSSFVSLAARSDAVAIFLLLVLFGCTTRCECRIRSPSRWACYRTGQNATHIDRNVLIFHCYCLWWAVSLLTKQAISRWLTIDVVAHKLYPEYCEYATNDKTNRKKNRKKEEKRDLLCAHFGCVVRYLW